MRQEEEKRLIRIIEGTATPEEQAAFEKWLSESSANQLVFEEWKWMKQLGAPVRVVPDAKEVDATWEQFVTRLDQNRSAAASGNLPLYKKPIFIVSSIAASILLIIGVFFGLQSGGSSSHPTSPAIAMQTESGQASQFQLPDGSVVWMNAGSKVQTKAGFGTEHRELRLEGEAYFEVTKNQDLPFVVQCETFNTTVLGTKFYVRSHEGSQEYQVAVTEGKVQVASKQNQEKVILTADQFVLIDGESGLGIADRREGSVDHFTAWRDGSMVYEDAPFEDVLSDIGRRFNVQVVAEPDLSKERIHVSFETETLDEILDIISITTGYPIEREGDVVTIRPAS